MMKNPGWQVKIGIVLIALSALVYYSHYLIFRDPHHIFIYMIGDIAFVFIEVLLVTLIIHRVLGEREKRERMEKLNMVIEVFFSEVGTKLLTYLSDFDPRLDKIRKDLIVTGDWSEEDFSHVTKKLKHYDYTIAFDMIDIGELRIFLMEKREFLVRLLENPVLLEHESFTKLLMAVFHLTEELEARKKVQSLPEYDYEHIKVDIERVYVLLVCEWLDYMKYLKNNYPFLFSFAMRTNPFDQNASPIVT
jgi:hypothetical protein